MKNTYPVYYKKFKCVADKCPDTCCAGWEIVVDSPSAQKYEAVGGEFGEKIRGVLFTDDDGDRIFRNENGRCPFLLDNGFCEMFIKLGEQSLCKTCADFPRHRAFFGSRCETGISLSCPEAIRIIMEDSSPITLEGEETDFGVVPSDFDAELYLFLLKARKRIFDIVQNRSRPLDSRLVDAVILCDRLNGHIANCDFSEAELILDSFRENEIQPECNPVRAKKAYKKYISDHMQAEFLCEEWKKNLSSSSLNDGAYPVEWEAEHFVICLLFRYLILACYDYDLADKIKFCISAYVVCKNLVLSLPDASDRQARITLMQRYSKEIEHSEYNMSFLRECRKRSRYYNAENLINILSRR